MILITNTTRGPSSLHLRNWPSFTVMKLYLDDDTASALLARLLRQAGHDVVIPADAGMVGIDDTVHFTYAVHSGRTILSRNHDDFRKLHNLIREVGGRDPGIMIVRRDNDPRRDLTDRG